jgi:alpha-aminoadipate carrier protein LysW
MSRNAPTTTCPVCDGPVVLDPGAVVSELVKCRECGTDLEVISVSPAAVAQAPAEEEDWGQ